MTHWTAVGLCGALDVGSGRSRMTPASTWTLAHAEATGVSCVAVKIAHVAVVVVTLGLAAIISKRSQAGETLNWGTKVISPKCSLLGLAHTHLCERRAR